MEECRRELVEYGLKPQKVDMVITDIQKELPGSQVFIRSEARRFAKVLLPDVKDKHVLFAAATVRADVLVTDDLGDFPSDLLENRHNRFLRLPDHFKAISLDEFLCDVFERNTDGFLDALTLTLVPMEQGTIRQHLTTLGSGHNCPAVSSRLLRRIAEIEQAVHRQH